MAVEPIKASVPPLETEKTVSTAAGTGRVEVRDQSSETEIVEKNTRATVTQIYSHSMDGYSAGNKGSAIKDIDRLRSDLELMMHIVKETNLRSLNIESRIALIQKNTSQLIKSSGMKIYESGCNLTSIF